MVRGLVVAAGLIALAGCSSDSPSDASSGGSAGQPSTVSTTVAPVAPSASDVATSAATTTSSSTSSTTTTIALFPEGAVVLVANAAEVPGAAAGLTQQLAAAGFVTLEPTNAAGNEARLDVSKVYFLPGGFDAATSIAAAMGGLQVAPMSVPAWIVGATAGLGNANVLVMLGADLAGQSIAALAGR